MKFRKNKKGFTIVELIIVIAVIGILTAVMVPTIVHLVGKANKASDEALVSNLNKAVQLRYSETGKKPETMHETVEGLKEYGYNVDALVAKSDESLLYNLKENRFVLEKSEGVLGHEENFWKVQDSLGDQKYNVYAGRNFSMNPVTGLHTGFDAADKSISSVTFESSTASGTYLVRTNGGVLEVDAFNASIDHHGNVNELTVTAVKKNASYHEYGVVAVKAILVSGSLDVMPDGYIKEVDTSGADAGSTLAVDGYVSKVVAAEGEGAIKATGNGYVADNAGEPMGTPAAINTSIASVNDLQAFKAKVNDGYDYSLLTVKLTANLDISSLAWEPIGNMNHPFVGTFDGQNHVISGLTNNGYEIDETDIQPSTYSGNAGSSYGFFGVIGGASEKATIIKNLALDEVAIDIRYAKCLGGLFGSDAKGFSAASYGGSITIENISVEGEIKSTNTSGVTFAGIGGKVYNPGRVDIKNCTNYADLIAIDALTGDVKVAGIVGYMSNSDQVAVVDGCKNYGNMNIKTMVEATLTDGNTTGAYASGIVSKGWGELYVKNCSTQGTTSVEASKADIFYSGIARLANYDCWVQGQKDFENTNYKKYGEWTEGNYIFGANNSISSEQEFDSFTTNLVAERNLWGDEPLGLRTLTSLEEVELFYWYDCKLAMPYQPGLH